MPDCLCAEHQFLPPPPPPLNFLPRFSIMVLQVETIIPVLLHPRPLDSDRNDTISSPHLQLADYRYWNCQPPYSRDPISYALSVRVVLFLWKTLPNAEANRLSDCPAPPGCCLWTRWAPAAWASGNSEGQVGMKAHQGRSTGRRRASRNARSAGLLHMS